MRRVLIIGCVLVPMGLLIWRYPFLEATWDFKGSVVRANLPSGRIIHSLSGLDIGGRDVTVIVALNSCSDNLCSLSRPALKSCVAPSVRCIPTWTPASGGRGILLTAPADGYPNPATITQMLTDTRTRCASTMRGPDGYGNYAEWKTLCIDPASMLLLYRSVRL